MKLIRLKVVNWRHLPPVEIGPLYQSVTVIHGPNRTGKSTLADAVKKGLFDKFKGKAEDIIPWSNLEAVPEVEVEFSVGGQRFLVHKKFSSRKSGCCNLFEIAGDGKRREISSGAEVDEEIRKRLRSTDKKSGIPEMLWVRQGEVNIPELDEEFAGHLHALLGRVVITETDDGVRKLISENLRQWFTDTAIKHKKFFHQDLDLSRIEQLTLQKGSASSPLNKLLEQIEGDQANLDEIERRLAEFDKDMENAQSVRDELRDARRDVMEAETELQALEANEGQIEEKKKQVARSSQVLEEARQKLQAIHREREDFEKCAHDLAECNQVHLTRLAEYGAGKAEQDRLKKERDEIREAISGLEEKLAELEDGALLESKQQILEITDEIGQLEIKLAQVKRLEDEIADARSRLQAIVVPVDRIRNMIDTHLDRITKLRAELEASQLNFSFLPERDLTFKLTLDRGEGQAVSGRAGEKILWKARQSLELAIPGIGEISFGRGEENQGLEKQARELDEARRELATILIPLGIDHTASTTEIITELLRRKEQYDTLQRKVSEKEEELKHIGDQGSAGLEGEIRRRKAERGNLVSSREDLKSWEPSRPALAEEKKAFTLKSREIKDRLAATREKLKGVGEELERASERQKTLGEDAATALAMLKVKQDDMADRQTRHASLEQLDALIAERVRELETLSREYESHRLTPEEEKFGERLREARDLENKRKDSEAQLKIKEATLEERLRGLEGFHAQKIRLEQKLAAAKREQARMETDIKALAILAQVFDRQRDSSVESSLKPVTDQIEPWLRELYGSEAKKIIFGSGMQAEKIVTTGGEFAKFETVTSHGELEQLSTLVRLAYGAVLAKEEPQLVILDDPLAHSDPRLRRKMHAVLEDAARKNLQLVIFTCNREGFDRISGAQIIDL